MLVIGLTRNRCGVESYILNMVRSFSRNCWELYFPANGAEVTFGEELMAMGHRFIRIPAGRGRHFIRFYREWNRIFQHYQFDAVYVNDCSIVQIDILRLAKWHHVPVRIFHAHNSSWMGNGPSLWHRAMAAWNKMHINSIATKLIGCSRESAEWMFPPNSRYDVIPNAIDVQKHAYSSEACRHIRQELGVGGAPLIGYIGRFAPEKNPLFFVQIVAELRKTLPDAVAVMVGEGELRPEVEAAMSDAGLPLGSIRLLGVRSDVADVMSALDCLVMPSLVEGFPYVLVEAQAHGLPCIVSDKVTGKTNIIGLVDFISLDRPGDWVEAICNALRKQIDRSSCAEEMRERGYDSPSVVAALEANIIQGVERGHA